jgi:hypothetical protein
MISLFPFTHISGPGAKLLAQALGPLTLSLPVDQMASDRMKAWVRDGLLNIQTPSGLDGSALMTALRGFKQWAGLHGTKLCDISDFYRFSQGRPPLVDDNGPGRILTQIRRRESGAASETPDRLFASALILALAHDHDMDQEAADRQLGSVEAMEAELYANIAGNGQDLESHSLLHSNPAAAAAFQDQDHRMSIQRLQAWACLAQASSPLLSSVFVTTSSAILDRVLERYPNAIPSISWELSDLDEAMALKQQRLDALEVLGRSSKPLALSADNGLAGAPGSARVALYVIPGVAPPVLLSGLSKMAVKIQDSRENGWLNSIVGLLES